MTSMLPFPYFYVLGDIEKRVHRALPIFPEGGPVRILVQVTAREDQAILERMQSALEEFGLDKPSLEVASFIFENPDFSSGLNSSIYVIAAPVGGMGVYQHWAPVGRMKDSTPKALFKFRSTPELGHALIYIIYKGEYGMMYRDGIYLPPPPNAPWVAEIPPAPGCSQVPNRGNLDRLVDVDNVRTALENSHLSAAENHAGDWSFGSPPLQSVSATTSIRQGSPAVPRQFVSTFPQWASTYLPAIQPSHHTLPLTQRSRAAGLDIPAQGVFRLHRDLSGIVGYETKPDTNVRGSVLGPVADEYFWAHGYQAGTVRLSQRAYERARSRECFIAELNQGGIPVAEAVYMFGLISQGGCM